MPASASFATARTSLSLPTHISTISALRAASAGDGADWPPCCSTHCRAFACVRL
jgi:hypothetical protein